MDIREIWLSHFRAAVDEEITAASGHKASAYRAIAQKLKIKPQYAYQIYCGKTKKNGEPRLPTDAVARALAREYGHGKPDGWVNRPPGDDVAALPPKPDITSSMGSVAAVLEFAARVQELSSAKRTYLKALLTDLINQPELAPELAQDIAGLLHQQLGKPIQPSSTNFQDGKRSNG